MKNVLIPGWVSLILLFSIGVTFAQEPRQVTISDVRGEAFVRQNQADWQQAAVGMVLHQNDEVKTSEGALVEILLDQGDVGKIKIDEKSRLRINTMTNDNTTGGKFTLLDLAIGKVIVQAEKLEKNSKFEIATPTGTTGVSGTFYEVSVVSGE